MNLVHFKRKWKRIETQRHFYSSYYVSYHLTLLLPLTLRCVQKKQKNAMAGDRTRIDCLEGNHAVQTICTKFSRPS